MDKKIMLTKIKKYLAEKYQCDVSELDKSGLNIIINNKQNRLKMLLLYDLVLVSSSSYLYDFVSKKLNNKNIYEIFEFPLAYGQSIYFVPDIERIKNQIETDRFTFKLFDGNTFEINLQNGFENAITFENSRCISDIAYCAYDGDKIIGVAGADKLNDDIWEVGIEVLPEYRKDGLATILTNNLTLRILEKGIVPIWCASSTNIGSQAVANKSNYIPLWFETFGDVFDDGYVYKEMINIDNIKNNEL